MTTARRGLVALRGPVRLPRTFAPLSAKAAPGLAPPVTPAPLDPHPPQTRSAKARSPWLATAASAGLHASAALALAATYAATGAGAMGDAGLDSLSLLPEPPALQVSFVTEADLLPPTPPAVVNLAPSMPPAPQTEAPPTAPLADTPPPLSAPSPLQALAADTTPQAPQLPQPPMAITAIQAPGASLPPPPPAPKAHAPVLTRSPAPEPEPAPAPDAPARAAKTASAPADPAPASRAAGSGGGTAAGEAGKAPDPGPSKAAVAELKQAWGGKVRSRVEAKKAYPAAAKGAAGTVKVRLTVSRAGKLLDVSVTASSGNAALDAAAVKAVRAARFPAAPKGLSEASYSFTLPIRYAP